MSVRLERMNEAIAHEVSAVLRKDFREEAAMVTIVGALVAPDFKSAIVKYSVLGGLAAERQAAKFFSKHATLIKKEIAHRLQLRSVPDLKFVVTDAIEKGNRLIEVLDTIAPEDTFVE